MPKLPLLFDIAQPGYVLDQPTSSSIPGVLVGVIIVVVIVAVFFIVRAILKAK